MWAFAITLRLSSVNFHILICFFKTVQPSGINICIDGPWEEKIQISWSFQGYDVKWLKNVKLDI
jgi:hypothetical protein